MNSESQDQCFLANSEVSRSVFASLSSPVYTALEMLENLKTLDWLDRGSLSKMASLVCLAASLIISDIILLWSGREREWVIKQPRKELHNVFRKPDEHTTQEGSFVDPEE